jgi:hypothetical protein
MEGSEPASWSLQQGPQLLSHARAMHTLRMDTVATEPSDLRPWQHVLIGAWREVRGRIRAARARRLRDDIEQVLGLRLQLVGMLQRRTCQDAQVIQAQVDSWLWRNISLGGVQPLPAGATPSTFGEHP